MQKILIGSKVLEHHGLIPILTSTDIDYAVSDRIKSNSSGIEYLYNPILCDKYKPSSRCICSLSDLYTLKISHLIGWDINTKKHLNHICLLESKMHSSLPLLFDKSLFDDLYEFWTHEHGPNKRSDLDMSSSDFFNNKIEFPIEHDELHELLIKHDFFIDQKEPMYKKVLEPGHDVLVSEERFNKLTLNEKLNLVREEVMVMAMERNYHHHYIVNYNIMLKRFFRNHAPLWEALFILQNYRSLKCPFNYKKHLEEYVIQR